MITLALAVLAAAPPVSASAASTLSVTNAGGVYVFTSTGTKTVRYRVDTTHPDVTSGLLRVEASVGTRPYDLLITKGGARWRNGTGAIVEPPAWTPGRSTLTGQSLSGNTLTLSYTDTPGTHVLTRTVRFTPVGAALRIQVSSSSTWGNDGYAGLTLGEGINLGGPEVVRMPYLPHPVALLPNGTAFTAYVDRTISSGSATGFSTGPTPDGGVRVHGWTLNELDTAGVAAALDETAWLTASDVSADTWPATDWPASPYRAALSQRVVLDMWGEFRSFLREGVVLSWSPPTGATGTSSVTLTWADAYADSPPGACSDGVDLVLRAGPTPDRVLFATHVADGQLTAQNTTQQVTLASGEWVRAELTNAGTNNCDSTQVRLQITAPGPQQFDSQTNFSGTQGASGFSWVELIGTQLTPMTYASGSWHGSNTYSLIGPTTWHPGMSPVQFSDAEAMLRRLAEYGMTRWLVLFHVWQRYGYDSGLPAHFPANPTFGGGTSFASLVTTAKALGMLFAPHENYTDMYPDAAPTYPSPLYDATARALLPSGQPKLGWLNEGTGQQAFVIAADRMAGLAAGQTSQIASAYAPNAAYLDVTTGWSPANAITFAASAPVRPTLKQATTSVRALFDGMRSAYSGPLLGEGGEGPGRFDTELAGLVDGVERQVEGRRDALVAPDFELSVVRPRMFNHGMGYYCRYFVPGGQANGLVAPDLDQYRASEIAFGHAGFVGECIQGVTGAAKIHASAREYWSMLALQTRYADAALSEVRYHTTATSMLLDDALRAGLDLRRARVELTFANGLKVFVNRDSSLRRDTSAGGFSSTQGRNGWAYAEELSPGVLTPLTWDFVNERWQGVGTYSRIWDIGAHPHGATVVRSFTVQVAGQTHLTGSFSDVDSSCGDGVDVSVTKGGSSLWAQTIANGGSAATFDLTTTVAVGDTFQFRINERTNNFCDSTGFSAVIETDDGQAHTWNVTRPSGTFALPPSGYLAEGPGFLARSTLVSGARADFVDGPEYTWVDGRSSTSRAIDAWTLDGALAVVHGSWGDDLHALQLTSASRGQLVLASSARADVNLTQRSARSARLVVRELGTASSANITWGMADGGVPSGWRPVLSAHPGDLVVSPALAASFTDAGIVLTGVLADVPVTLSLSSQCLVDAECSGTSCVAGRCADAGVDAGLDGGVDAGADAGADAGVDGGPDAGLDAGADGGPDASVDAGGADASVDAGSDGGLDPGSDGGAPDGGVGPGATGGCGCTTGSPVQGLLCALALALVRRRTTRRGGEARPVAGDCEASPPRRC